MAKILTRLCNAYRVYFRAFEGESALQRVRVAVGKEALHLEYRDGKHVWWAQASLRPQIEEALAPGPKLGTPCGDDPREVQVLGLARYRSGLYYIRGYGPTQGAVHLIGLNGKVSFSRMLGGGPDEVTILERYHPTQQWEGKKLRSRLVLKYRTLAEVQEQVRRAREAQKGEVREQEG